MEIATAVRKRNNEAAIFGVIMFTLFLALVWLVEAWRRGRMREVVRVFAPVCCALLLSFILYGFWPMSARVLSGAEWNQSAFPYSIPIGLAFVARSIKTRKIDLSIAAGPCFSPYLSGFSWVFVVMGFLRSRLAPFVILLSWVIGREGFFGICRLLAR